MTSRRRIPVQTDPLEQRLAGEAARLREQAGALPPGSERERLLRRARQAETGSQMSEWLRSPGLQPPTAHRDAENAKRFRDKAAEALQLAGLAETESRRDALTRIADHYNRAADQLDGIAAQARPGNKG